MTNKVILSTLEAELPSLKKKNNHFHENICNILKAVNRAAKFYMAIQRNKDYVHTMTVIYKKG